MNIDEDIVEVMLKMAEKAYYKGEIPVSAVIVDKSGNIICKAFNDRQRNHNVLGHAEVLAILEAEKKVKDWRLDGYSMIVSLEPCDMCSMVINECRLDKVFYFISKNSEDNLKSIYINKVEIEGFEEYKSKFRNLLTSFFDNRR